MSKLTRLEELNVPGGFLTSEDDSMGISAELSTLNWLRNLTINFRESRSCPSNIMDNLDLFRINVGKTVFSFFGSNSSVRRAIRFGFTEIEGGWISLLDRAEYVELEQCYDLQHIARWDGRNQQLKCFTNLRNLYVTGCPGLEYVFSSRVANCLVQLQTLHINFCSGIEEIVRVDDGEETISFPKIYHLYLAHLPSLTSFTDIEVEFSQLKSLYVEKCEKIEVLMGCTMLHGFQNLEDVCINDCDSLIAVLAANSDMVFPALKLLKLQHLPNLDRFFISYDIEFPEIDDSESYTLSTNTLFTSTAFRSFQQLEEITVSDCKLDGILEGSGETYGINQLKTPISLLELKSITLSDLPNLQNSRIFACYMPALSVVEVENCAISSLFTCSAFRNLHNLKSIKVKKCHLLEQISVDDTDDETPGPSENMISLPLLKTIQLEHLHGLKSFSSSSTFTFSMPALKDITVSDCPCMDKFTFLQTMTPLLEGDLNDYVRRKVYGKYIYTEDNAEEDGDGESDDGNSIPDVSVDGDQAEGDSESSKEYQEL